MENEGRENMWRFKPAVFWGDVFQQLRARTPELERGNILLNWADPVFVLFFFAGKVVFLGIMSRYNTVSNFIFVNDLNNINSICHFVPLISECI